jgi:hypothetical protein
MPIQLPDSMFAVPEIVDTPQPPPDPMVARELQIADTTRAEQGLNQFLAAKQNMLFDAPDAFYRQQGEDAIHATPVTTQKLDDLRNDLLDRLGNDAQRNRLRNALDAQMELTRDGMSRHVAEQSEAWQRQVAQDRIALLTKEAAHHHNDDELIDALGHAAANAARAHSRVGDGPPGGDAEDAAVATARSGVLGAAIQARLDRGDTAGANALFTQVQDHLDFAHAGPLQEQVESAGLQGTHESAPSDNGIVPVNHALNESVGATRVDPQLAQTKPSASVGRPSPPSAASGNKAQSSPSQPSSGPPPGMSQNEMDTALMILRDMRRKEREPVWETMIQAKLPDTSPGTQRQAPLSEDWRTDVNKINSTYAGFIDKAAAKYKIPAELLARLFHRESSFDVHKNTQLVNGNYVPVPKKAVGIPQMFPSAAQDAGVTRSELANGTAEFQINAGAKYLAQQFDRFQDWPKAAAAYHSGYPTLGDWLNGSGPNFEDEEQRKAAFVKWDDDIRDGKGKKLPSRWRLIQPDSADPKIAEDLDHWKELKEYLPYIFMGDPKRYDPGNITVPKRQ